MICNGPITYIGQAEVAKDIELFKSALAESGVTPEETFMCVLAPGWLEHFFYNEYYKDDEAYLFAIADAMHEEYKAIVDAGFILQLDDPGLPDTWDMIVPRPSIPDYRKFAELRVDAQNHALKGIPADRVRYHICWGSWHGPHVYDIELKHVVDLMLQGRRGSVLGRGGEPAPRARVEGVEGHEAAGGQDPHPRRRQPRQQRRRAPGAGGGPHHPVRRAVSARRT